MPSRKRKPSSTHAEQKLRKVTKKTVGQEEPDTKPELKSALQFNSNQEDEYPPGRLTFMDLPKNVRERVYRYSGLVRDCFIHLHNPHDGCNKSERYYDAIAKPKPTLLARPLMLPPTPNGELVPRPCFTPTHNERLNDPHYMYCNCKDLPLALLRVSKAVHSETEATLYSRNKFRILRNLHTSCEVLETLSDRARFSITMLEIVLGEITNSDFRDEYGQGAALACLGLLLAKHFDSGRLKLHFSCRIPGLRSKARGMFSKALSEVRLSECIISLHSREAWMRALYRGQMPREDLASKLVTDMVVRHNVKTTAKFRFRDLPKKVRLMVLQQTSLVASETEQRMGKGFQSRFGRLARQTTCCGDCSNAGTRMPACACFGQGFIASSTCTCDRTAQSLYLVDRLMNKEATEVFTRCNNFYLGNWRRNPNQMLHRCGTEFMSNIRHLNLWLNGSPVRWPYDMGSALGPNEITGIARVLRDRANLRAMHVTILLKGHIACQHSPGFENRHPGPLFLPELMWSLAPTFKCLKSFIIYALCSDADEDYLEKLVMGDNYNSAEHGKLEREERDLRYPNLPKGNNGNRS